MKKHAQNIHYILHPKISPPLELFLQRFYQKTINHLFPLHQ